MSNKIIVHHLNDSRSQRILWLLVSPYIFSITLCSTLTISQEELELPYEIKQHTRQSDQRAPPELLAVNPLGKSPVIQDGDVTLAESGAIMPVLVNKLIFQIIPTQAPFFIRPLLWIVFGQ
ncbi:hypothetical protein HWV62_14102, partial [Athelia sp. TMB]